MAVPLLIGAATMLVACGEEEPATTAQPPEAQGAAKPDPAELEAGAAQEANRGEGKRSKQAQGDGARGSGKREQGEPGGDRRASGSDKPGRDGAEAPKPPSSAAQELEAAAQELLAGGEGERPDKGSSGLRIPPGLRDEGGKPGNPLKNLCLDPDECPGVSEGPG